MGLARRKSRLSSSTAAGDQSILPSEGLRATSGWLIACLVVFLWWASTYRALVEVLAEWQFTHLGRYYPSLTVSLVVLILVLPIALVVGWQRRRRRRRFDHGSAAAEAVAPRVLMARAIRSAQRSRLFFAGLALVAGLVALGVFLSILWLPPDSGPVRTIAKVEGSVQPEGAAAFARPFRLGRVARIEENVGLARRVLYVAPVYLEHGHDEDGFLTTVLPLPTPPLRFAPIASGVLVERGVPQELVNLYHAADVPVPQRSYLLMRDGATVRWRPLVLGIQTALLALVALVLSLLFRHQARRLRRVLADEMSSTPA